MGFARRFKELAKRVKAGKERNPNAATPADPTPGVKGAIPAVPAKEGEEAPVRPVNEAAAETQKPFADRLSKRLKLKRRSKWSKPVQEDNAGF